MLNNPTLENISLSDKTTRNGDIMFQMKNAMYLEVPLSKMKYIIILLFLQY